MYIKVDKDFSYMGTDYWYRAEVDYYYCYIPATWDSPAEEDSDIVAVAVYEVERYGKKKVYDITDLPTALCEAIKEDAIEYTRIEGGNNNVE